VALTASVVALNAQSGAGFGVKGGLNLASLTVTGDDVDDDFKMKPGFHLGVFANVPLGGTLSFQPELVYSAEGAKFEDIDDAKVNLSYLNVPLLIQYNASGFFAETGPQVGFLMGAKAKADDEDEDIKDSFKSTNFSWAVGLGFKTATGFGVGARYNLGLANIAEEATDDNKLKSNVIQISLFKTLGRR
ncbi:MAG TPA: porin family protein, partial [Chitinophagaceae bacterium]|nr:porin family protein [Chitinophagaceae bacterium]